VSNVSLMPVPAEPAGATCANCGAALVADQRYCLECGQPASPVRLAFLDVLQAEENPSGVGPSTIEMSPAGYVSVDGQQGVNGWLRRNSGLLGLFSVLLMCLIVGLLVGHWASQGGTPSKSVVEVKGLSAAPAAAATTAPSSTTSTTTPAVSAQSKAKAKAQAAEAKEAAKETKAEKAPPPAPVKVTPTKIKKLSTSTGKQHVKEVNELGDQPIETG
jgi:hypothetical protein